MRLIDADVALQRFIKETETSGKNAIHINTIKRLLQDMDTAYDVEKVVEELGKEKEIHTEHYKISLYKDYSEIKQRYEQIQGVIDKAIDIVRKGGME